MGLQLDETLKRLVQEARPYREEPLILLLGYPIPKNVGGDNIELAWQAMEFPLPTAASHIEREKTLWRLDRAGTFRDDVELTWLTTDNVSDSHQTVRGTLPTRLRLANVVLIGCGALGSAVAALLVRKGLNNLTLIDWQRLELGNLRRHALSISDVPHSKAERLAAHLNAVSLFANVVALDQAFPDGDTRNVVDSCDLVIDCTAEDAVIDALSVPAESSRRYVSFSSGAFARSMLAFCNDGNALDASAFYTASTPYVEREATAMRGETDLRDVGCHNPTFPAPWDNILIHASWAIHFLVEHDGLTLPAAVARVIENDRA